MVTGTKQKENTGGERMKNRVIKYICNECFKEFSQFEREEALQHCRFTHKNPSYCKQLNGKE
jgi:hypothetical protein